MGRCRHGNCGAHVRIPDVTKSDHRHIRPEIISTLQTWAGTEKGGFKRLENDLPADSLEQLEEDFSLAAAIGTEAEQDDDTAAAAIKPSSASDDAWDALYSSFKASTQQEEKREKILRFSAIIT
jgi:hypothetical protein